MAVYSMTGYASATAGAVETPVTQIHSVTEAPSARASSGSNVSVEARSVNGRFLDLAFRLPDEFRSLEPALREQLTKTFRRGKIELRINARSNADSAWPQPQTEQLNRLTRLESTVHGWFPKAQGFSVHEVLQWCKGAAPAEKLIAPGDRTVHVSRLRLVPNSIGRNIQGCHCGIYKRVGSFDENSFGQGLKMTFGPLKNPR